MRTGKVSIALKGGTNKKKPFVNVAAGVVIGAFVGIGPKCRKIMKYVLTRLFFFYQLFVRGHRTRLVISS